MSVLCRLVWSRVAQFFWAAVEFAEFSSESAVIDCISFETTSTCIHPAGATWQCESWNRGGCMACCVVFFYFLWFRYLVGRLSKGEQLYSIRKFTSPAPRHSIIATLHIQARRNLKTASLTLLLLQTSLSPALISSSCSLTGCSSNETKFHLLLNHWAYWGWYCC